MFYVAAAIYTFGAIIYVSAAAGEIQNWAKPYMTDDKMEMTPPQPSESKNLLDQPKDSEKSQAA